MKHLIRTLWCIASLAFAFISCEDNLQPDPGTGTDPGQEVVTDTPEEILIGVAQTYAVDTVEVRESDYLFVFANPTPIKLKKDYPEGISEVILEKKNVRKYSDDGHDISVTFTDGKTAVLSRDSWLEVTFDTAQLVFDMARTPDTLKFTVVSGKPETLVSVTVKGAEDCVTAETALDEDKKGGMVVFTPAGSYFASEAEVTVSNGKRSVTQKLSLTREDTGFEEVVFDRSSIVFDMEGTPDTLKFTVVSGKPETGAEVTVKAAEDCVTAETSMSADGKEGMVIFTPVSGNFTTVAAVTVSDGRRSVTHRVTLVRDEFRFEDGSVSKSFSFREYGRLFAVRLSEADRTVEVSVSEGCDGWLKTNMGNENVNGKRETFVRVLLSENTGDTQRSATLTLTRPGRKGGLVINVSQLGAKMPGSLRRALTAFYGGLNGADWVRSDNWCTDRPLHEWYGIKPCSDMVSKECMGETGVTYHGTDDRWSLELKSNNMRGQIPQEFWECGTLADITVNREYLPTTTVPDCVWREGLTTLDLSTTFISVPLTSSIARAQNLRTLNLELCPVNGELPPEIASLTKLEYLNLYLNSMTGQLPGNIGNMKALKEIYIQGEPGFGGTIPDSFYDLKNLEQFHINGTSIKGTISKKISNLQQLVDISLTENEFEGTIPEEIGELRHLIAWNFEKNYFDAIPEFVRYRAWNCRTGAGTFMQDYGDWTFGGFSVGVPYCQKRKGYQYSDYYIEELYSVYDDILVDGQPLRRTRLIRDYPKGSLKHFPLPVWAHVKYGFKLWARSSEFKNPVFPHSDDLQYPASEYYYDGKDWRHPSLEYPAKEYYKEGDEWLHDASCPWEEEYWYEGIEDDKNDKGCYGY